MSTGEDNTVRVYDLRDGTTAMCFREHMSTPTAVAIAPDGYMMASVGRDKVMNVYTLRGYRHVKTIPVMEELEGVVMLTPRHARVVLGREAPAKGLPSSGSKGKKDGKAAAAAAAAAAGLVEVVAVTAGIKGVLRVFHLSMVGKDAATFTWALLAAVPLHPSPALPAAGSSSSSGGGSEVSSYSVVALHYLPKSAQIAAVTADHNFCFYTVGPAIATTPASAGAAASVLPRRQLIGCNDDILDIIVVPPSAPSSSSAAAAAGDDDDENGDGVGRHRPTAASPADANTVAASFRLALITNSPQVRMHPPHFVPVPTAYECFPLTFRITFVPKCPLCYGRCGCWTAPLRAHRWTDTRTSCSRPTSAPTGACPMPLVHLVSPSSLPRPARPAKPASETALLSHSFLSKKLPVVTVVCHGPGSDELSYAIIEAKPAPNIGVVRSNMLQQRTAEDGCGAALCVSVAPAAAGQNGARRRRRRA